MNWKKFDRECERMAKKLGYKNYTDFYFNGDSNICYEETKKLKKKYETT